MLPHSLLLRLTNTEHDTHDVVDARYWLVHSDGFLVDGPSGRVGVVSHTIDGRNLLIVRTGVLGNHQIPVPFSEVDSIEPWDERLTLRSEPTSAA